MVILFDQEFATKRYGNRMRAEGYAEGYAEGVAQGREEVCLASLRALLTNTAYTPDQAMDVLEIPPADREKYKALLAPHS